MLVRENKQVQKGRKGRKGRPKAVVVKEINTEDLTRAVAPSSQDDHLGLDHVVHGPSAERRAPPSSQVSQPV